MRRGPPSVSIFMDSSTSAADLSRSIVNEQSSQGAVWEAIRALQAYARSLLDSCFGRRLRVNTRELKIRRQIAEGGE